MVNFLVASMIVAIHVRIVVQTFEKLKKQLASMGWRDWSWQF